MWWGNNMTINVERIASEIKLASSKTGSKSDCVVRALAVVLYGYYTYESINEWLQRNGFRKNGRTKRGASLAFLNAHQLTYTHYYREFSRAFLQYGRNCYHIPDDKFDGKTIKSFQAQRYKGRFIVTTYGHLLGVIDGHVVDWSDGRQHRIKAITLIHPIKTQ